MVQPLVSTLVITHNQERYAPELMRSLVYQDYENQSIIISDDASTDATEDIISSHLEHLNRFTHVEFTCHQTNLGLLGRENIRYVSSRIHSEAKYVQIVEGDDALLPHKTTRCVEYLEAHPEAGGVHGDFIIKYENGAEQVRGWPTLGRPYIPSGQIFDILIAANFVMTCTAMWRRDIYDKAFDYELFTKHGIVLGDYAGTLRAARLAEIHYIDEELAKYTWNPKGTVNNPANRPRIIDDTVKLQRLAREGLI